MHSNLEKGFKMEHLIEANGNKLSIDFSTVKSQFSIGSHNLQINFNNTIAQVNFMVKGRISEDIRASIG